MFCRASFPAAVLFALVLTATSGCGEQTEGFVHIDNGSEELIVVYVDGKQKARIGPGRQRKLTLPLGEREFKVVRGDETIYEAKHKLEVGNRPFRRPTYVLNPDQNNRYCRVQVVYYDEQSSESNLEDLITMISNSKDDQVESAEEQPAGDNPEPDASEAAELAVKKTKTSRAIVRKYRQVSQQLVAMGDQPFFQVEGLGELFKPMPTVVYSRSSGDQVRTTLARVPAVLHDFAAESAQVKKPTAQQLQRLEVAHEVAISYVPFQ